jgi:hypothetical protein
MKRNWTILLVLFGLFLLIIIFYITFKKFENPDKILFNENNFSVEPSEITLAFIDSQRDWIDFDNKCIACILNKSCGGEIWLEMRVNLSEDISHINQTLTKYGNVSRIFSFNSHSILFETNDLYHMDEILNWSVFNEIQISNIETYFDFNNESLFYCEEDSECVFVTKGCCGCGESTSISINKKYIGDWSSCSEASCFNAACAAVISNHWTCYTNNPKCVENKCELGFTNESICNREYSLHNYSLYDICKEMENYSRTEPNKLAMNDKSFFGEINLSCNELLDICEN